MKCAHFLLTIVVVLIMVCSPGAAIPSAQSYAEDLAAMDANIAEATEIFTALMTPRKEVYYVYKTLGVRIAIKVDWETPPSQAVAKLSTAYLTYAQRYPKQGLIWRVEPYFDPAEGMILGLFIIEWGVTQYI